MRNKIERIIFDIFNSTYAGYEAEDDIIKDLCLKYRTSDISIKLIIIESLFTGLSKEQLCIIEKWCMLFYKIISSDHVDSDKCSLMLNSIMSCSTSQNSLLDVLCRKLGVILLAFYVTNSNAEIDLVTLIEIFSATYGSIYDHSVGLISSFVLSRFLNNLKSTEFEVIAKTFFSNFNDANICPQLYFMILNLKPSYKLILQKTSSENISIVINYIKLCADNQISAIFNCLMASDVFNVFWMHMIDTFTKSEDVLGLKIILNCLIESISPKFSGFIKIDNQKSIINEIWNDERLWHLFIWHLTDSKSDLQPLCTTFVENVRDGRQTITNDMMQILLTNFLKISNDDYFLRESLIPKRYRISHLLFNSNVATGEQFESYMYKIQSIAANKDNDKYSIREKLFFIEQFAFISQQSRNVEIEDRAIISMFDVLLRDLSYETNSPIEMDNNVSKMSFSIIIESIHNCLSRRENVSLRDYLFYLKNNLIVKCIEFFQSKGKRSLLKTFDYVGYFKSISYYIGEQINVDFGDQYITDVIFPYYGLVICYLSLLLLLKAHGKDLKRSALIIDWIKECFKSARHSVGNLIDHQTSSQGSRRTRMLSLSSLCEGENSDDVSRELPNKWTNGFLDILLKMYEENTTHMQEIVRSIIKLMVSHEIIDMLEIRYLKDLIIFPNVQEKKVAELSQLPVMDNLFDSMMEQTLKARDFQERCLNIISTIAFECNDSSIISSCFFIMLEMYSSKNEIIKSQIGLIIETFKRNSQGKNFKSYLNCSIIEKAMNKIFNLSCDISHCSKYSDLAADIVFSLLKRSSLTDLEGHLKFLTERFENGSNIEKLIVYRVLMEYTDITWMLREKLLRLIRKDGNTRVQNYRIFSLFENCLKVILNNKLENEFEKFDDFVNDCIHTCFDVLDSIDMKYTNVKYLLIIIQCLINLFRADRTGQKISEKQLQDIENIILSGSPHQIIIPLKILLSIHNNRKLNYQMSSLECLVENDSRFGSLMKLLPIYTNHENDSRSLINEDKKLSTSKLRKLKRKTRRSIKNQPSKKQISENQNSDSVFNEWGDSGGDILEFNGINSRKTPLADGEKYGENQGDASVNISDNFSLSKSKKRKKSMRRSEKYNENGGTCEHHKVVTEMDHSAIVGKKIKNSEKVNNQSQSKILEDGKHEIEWGDSGGNILKGNGINSQKTPLADGEKYRVNQGDASVNIIDNFSLSKSKKRKKSMRRSEEYNENGGTCEHQKVVTEMDHSAIVGKKIKNSEKVNNLSQSKMLEDGKLEIKEKKSKKKRRHDQKHISTVVKANMDVE